MSNGSIAQKHHFNTKDYDEVVRCLSEFAGFVLNEAKREEKLDQEKLGRMLNIYLTNCIVKGPSDDATPPEGSACQHVYVKGNNEGHKCGRKAKYVGVDSLPKCSTHKNSRPSKTNGSLSKTPQTSSTGETFSYAENRGKGKTIPQSMTSIQSTISEQQKPAELKLAQTMDGKYYHQSTKLVFEQQAVDGQQEWVCVGLLVDNNTEPLTKNDILVCWGNQWKWDPSTCQSQENQNSYVSSVGGDHPLVVQDNSELIKKKLESVTANSTL